MAKQLKKEEILQLSGNNIFVNFVDKRTNLINKKNLIRILLEIVSRENKQISYINYNFCSDEYLLEINKKHLNHNYFTDIITFELNPKDGPIEADIYLSLERVKENSKVINTPYLQELKRVMIHGLLHCCGYLDKTKKQQQIMRKKEDEYLLLWM